MQQERRAFFRGEPLEQREKRHRQVVAKLEIPVRRRRGDDGFRKPGADVRVALGFQPAEAVDGEPAGGGDQPRLGAVDPRVRRLMPPQVGLLDDVLGFGAGSEHPVGEAGEPASQRFESGSG